ncbi:hypothetical protein Ddye_019374 [Dipteronia dyeriana]|uniref:Uncharacterized protein n=1 Tax=Dipteronia dyeriana TaxID=168575 RepID=A0AAD9TYS2_9ROSI|nr:hypothetical protein Ddye_019374 [Dipteronia dyeriana]
MWAKFHLTGMHVEGKDHYRNVISFTYVMCTSTVTVLIGVKLLRRWPFFGRLRVCFVEPPYFQMTVKPIFTHVTELSGIAGSFGSANSAAVGSLNNGRSTGS